MLKDTLQVTWNAWQRDCSCVVQINDLQSQLVPEISARLYDFIRSLIKVVNSSRTLMYWYLIRELLRITNSVSGVYWAGNKYMCCFSVRGASWTIFVNSRLMLEMQRGVNVPMNERDVRSSLMPNFWRVDKHFIATLLMRINFCPPSYSFENLSVQHFWKWTSDATFPAIWSYNVYNMTSSFVQFLTRPATCNQINELIYILPCNLCWWVYDKSFTFEIFEMKNIT